MRARNQEAAKSKLLNTMEANELFLVFDWAMKFLPRKYRGDQLNWFGKRGISWHISVVFRRVGTELQTMTYIHIFEGAVSQDATTSSAVICDVINSVLSIHPTIKKLHLWSDNAACYKCAETFTRLKNNDLSVGKLCSYDFCESQDGKGPCDRTAATLKSNIKRYVDRGNDVENAAQMKKVNLSNKI